MFDFWFQSKHVQDYNNSQGVMRSTQQLREANRLDILLSIPLRGDRERVAASMQLKCLDPRLLVPTWLQCFEQQRCYHNRMYLLALIWVHVDASGQKNTLKKMQQHCGGLNPKP